MKRMNRLWSLFIVCLLVLVTVPFVFAETETVAPYTGTAAEAIAQQDEAALAAANESERSAQTDAVSTESAEAATPSESAPAQSETPKENFAKKQILRIASGVLCAVGVVLIAIGQLLAKKRKKMEQ